MALRINRENSRGLHQEQTITQNTAHGALGEKADVSTNLKNPGKLQTVMRIYKLYCRGSRFSQNRQIATVKQGNSCNFWELKFRMNGLQCCIIEH